MTRNDGGKLVIQLEDIYLMLKEIKEEQQKILTRLEVQDGERKEVQRRLDHLERKDEEQQKTIVRLESEKKDFERRISSLEMKVYWFLGLWIAGAVGALFLLLKKGG